MTPTNQENFRAALARIESLAPAPRTLGRALQLLRNPESGLQAIAHLISCDSAIAVDVLRCANSAYYSRTAAIVDVGEALQVIGFQEAIRLVSMVTSHQMTHRNLGCYGIEAGDFWAESLFNGLFVEALAKRMAVVDPGEAYTAGLLRFIGRIAINQVLDELGGNLFWDGSIPLSAWERDYVGCTQAEVAGWLLRKWSFPERIVVALESQDAPSLGGAAADEPLAQCVHFAAQILPAGTGLKNIEIIARSGVSIPERHPLTEELRLTDESVSEMLQELHVAFLAVSKTL